MNSEISICNRALRYLGSQEIASFDQDCTEAKLCSELYPSIRDTILLASSWSFATTTQELLPSSKKFTNAYNFAYVLPKETLRVIKIVEGFKYYEIIGNVLHSDSKKCKAELLIRITDVDSFSPLFKESLSMLLASHLALPLMESKELEILMKQRYATVLRCAIEIDKNITFTNEEYISSCGITIPPKVGSCYRHKKGAYYVVTGNAIHTETEEELVIYQDVDEHVWVRPLKMFMDGRFTLIS